MIAQHRIILPNGGELHISSMWRAQVIYPEYAWVVSLLDPPKTQPGFSAKHHLVYRIHDTERPTPQSWVLTRPDMERILNLKVGSGEKGLVHCHAGISRSTATGIMLAHKHGASLDAIKAGIDWSIADPNISILGWSSLMCGEDLVTPVQQWVREAMELKTNWRYIESN